MLKSTLAVIAVLAILMTSLVPAAALYYGPGTNVTPTITQGGTVGITLTTASSTTSTTAPQGSQVPCNGSNPSVCVFPQVSCTSSVPGTGFFYLVHQVTVKDPNGYSYMLGSAATSGLFWPSDLGGSGSSTSYPPQAAALNVTIGDNFVLPFGPAAGGFSFISALGNPPNDVAAGPYYWWTVAGNINGGGLRLDQHPSINPTSFVGTYEADVEGVVICGTSHTFFDDALQFTVSATTTSSGATRTIGFWQTHLALEQSVWASYISTHQSGASICGLTVTTASQAMGGLWASIPKDSSGGHRSAVDQAEMILVQQWIGGLLNTQAFGTSDGGLLAAGAAACSTDNVNTITAAANALDAFNSGGDNIPSPIATGHATPQAAKAFADISFWDNV